MNYGFTVSYDGSRYEGWQRQVRTRETIQGKLEDTLEKITGVKGQVIGAGRTDAGVHAIGQYANVHLQEEYDLKLLEDAWNRALPDDISIHGLTIMDERFHSRFSAREKHYRYCIRLSAEKDVFRRRYVWQLGEVLDVHAMKRGPPFFWAPMISCPSAEISTLRNLLSAPFVIFPLPFSAASWPLTTGATVSCRI